MHLLKIFLAIWLGGMSVILLTAGIIAFPTWVISYIDDRWGETWGLRALVLYFVIFFPLLTALLTIVCLLTNNKGG